MRTMSTVFCCHSGLHTPQLQSVFLHFSLLQEAPFTMKEKSESGGYRYVGFCIDLINALAEQLDFTYELYEPEDGQYGAEER
ncbi:GRIK3 [Branchiostoma lanceolatum]|uniref:GRIK3 protein n=1 Tax=Branchiostoma lanceolatum TaxID=7740 RepID=A0A8S4MP53_BRALA|nr:GRIK3 [Branchiostoma lanceolatum]